MFRLPRWSSAFRWIPAVLVLVGALAAIVAVIGLRSRQSLEDLLDTRIVGHLSAAFEPPEPADETRTDDQIDETDGDRR